MSGWFLVIIGIIIVFSGITLILYLVQEKIIVHAVKLSKHHKFDFPGNFEEMNLEADDGHLLNAVLFKVKEARGLVFYLHNHSGNLEHSGNLAFYLNSLQQDVLVIDYRGFGKTLGRFNEEDTYKDIRIWYEHLKNNYSEEVITLYGRGIGATFAAYLAKQYHPKRLILESPLYDLSYTAKKYYPLLPKLKYISNYSFDTAMHFSDVTCPVIIIHGKKNKLVHYSNSQKLYELNKKNTQVEIMPDGDHHNMMKQQKYQELMSKAFRA